MALGFGLLVVGVILVLLSRLTGSGWLPGDVVIRRGNLTCVFPLATSLLLSILLTLLLNLVIGGLRR